MCVSGQLGCLDGFVRLSAGTYRSVACMFIMVFLYLRVRANSTRHGARRASIGWVLSGVFNGGVSGAV